MKNFPDLYPVLVYIVTVLHINYILFGSPPTMGQWQFSGNPMTIQCAWNLDPSPLWSLTGERMVGSKCASSGLPMVFQCVPIVEINTGLQVGHHWVLASASVVPVASQCTCDASGLPVCSNYANDELWIATGRPVGESISQCGSSVVCPVVSQCTGSIWFGGY